MSELNPEQRRRLKVLGEEVPIADMSRAILRATVVVGNKIAPDNPARVPGYDDEVVYDAARDFLTRMAGQLGEMSQLNDQFVEAFGSNEARTVCFGELSLANRALVRATYGSHESPTVANFNDSYTPHRGSSADYALHLVDRAMVEAIDGQDTEN